MVSFQKLPELSDHHNTPITKKRSETQGDSHETSSVLSPTKKMRKFSQEEEFLDERRWRSQKTRSLLIDVDLRLHTPRRTDHNTPWKQTQNLCNTTTTQKTTSSSIKDPISLDLGLGLNLLCSTKSSTGNNKNYPDTKEGSNNLLKPNTRAGNYYTKNFAGELVGRDEEEEEMVAKACMRCHMLVMMCKSSPSCPNCKFMHPLDHNNAVLLLKPRPTNNNKASSCVS